jgi:hypothetical protein
MHPMNFLSENRPGNANRKNAEWEALVRGLEDSLDTISRAFASPAPSTSESILGVEAGIRRGYCALHNRRTITETLRTYGLVKKWDEIATYAMLAASPSDVLEQIENTTAVLGRRMMEFLVELRRAACSDAPGDR